MMKRASIRTIGTVAMIGVAASTVGGAPAAARSRHRHVAAAPAATEMSPPPSSSFYPETIEGGSAGNLPFNNQIRKLRDPLNANGAGR